MCAGGVVPASMEGEGSMKKVEAPKVHPHKLQHMEKLRKAKEKYMKIHEDNVERDIQIAAQRKAEMDATPQITTDLLAHSSVYCRSFNALVSRCYNDFQRSKLHRILFSTSQPCHIIVVVAVLCVSSALIPPSAGNRATARQPRSSITTFVYLATFVAHLGGQIFMTFVSGLSLYFALPRHAFAEVQRVLFPRYFSINATLSFITLLIFVKQHPMPTWDREISVQIGAMFIAFFLELSIRLYFIPPLLALVTEKTSIERAAGVGNEIGCHNLGSLKNCPHYIKIYNAFRHAHATIAMGNMVTMACTSLHLYYIASNLCVS